MIAGSVPSRACGLQDSFRLILQEGEMSFFFQIQRRRSVKVALFESFGEDDLIALAISLRQWLEVGDILKLS